MLSTTAPGKLTTDKLLCFKKLSAAQGLDVRVLLAQGLDFAKVCTRGGKY
jgi:hypothetical protein